MMKSRDQADADGDTSARTPLLVGVVAAATGAVAIAISAILQIASSYYFCIQEVGRDLDHARPATGQLELDLTPVVVCKTAHGIMEFPIAGAVTSLGTAIVLLVVLGISAVVYRARG